MKPAEEIHQVNERLLFWQGYDPKVKTDLCSHAIRTPEGWVIVDPIPVADELLEDIKSSGDVAAIVITSVNHERAAADFKKKTGARVYAHEEGRDELTADVWLRDGDDVAGLKAVSLPGFAIGEIALYSGTGSGTMIMGDALINTGSYGYGMLPGKYCEDGKEAARSIRKLLQFDFEIMTFAHGLPITSGAKRKLEGLLL
jgi:glyoxylase-like metal-dependent hydrolase (beta-lactamase superfamily II)